MMPKQTVSNGICVSDRLNSLKHLLEHDAARRGIFVDGLFESEKPLRRMPPKKADPDGTVNEDQRSGRASSL